MWSRTLVSTDSLSRRVIKQCNHHSDGIIIAMPRRHLAGKAEKFGDWLLFVDREGSEASGSAFLFRQSVLR